MSAKKREALSYNPYALIETVEKNPKITADEVRDWLYSGAEINLQGRNGMTVLHLLLQNNTLFDTLRAVLEAKADVNLQDFNGMTALHWAIRIRATDPTIRALLEAGAKVNFKDHYGMTALHWAFFLDSIFPYKDPIQKKEIREPWHWTLPNNIAYHYRQRALGPKSIDTDRCLLWSTVGTLLEAGADVDLQDNCGRTTLHWALRTQVSFAMISRLLTTARPNVNLQDCNGMAALHWATLYKAHADTIRILLQAGANVNHRDRNNNTPLMCMLNTLKMLKQEKKMYRKNPEQWRGYMSYDDLEKNSDELRYMSYDDLDTVEALLEAGAKVHRQKINDDTDLSWVLENMAHPSILKLLQPPQELQCMQNTLLFHYERHVTSQIENSEVPDLIEKFLVKRKGIKNVTPYPDQPFDEWGRDTCTMQ